MSIDFRDDLETAIYLFGEDEALENIFDSFVKKDNIECCVCLTNHWGVKLPNCNHFICPKCYYKLFNGFLRSGWHIRHPLPTCPEPPIYPYKNANVNREIIYRLKKDIDEVFLEWFTDDNEDLYNSVKLNTEFVANLDVDVKLWFQNNEAIEKYYKDVEEYNKDLEQYYMDVDEYNNLYADEKEANAQKICPLCRL